MAVKLEQYRIFKAIADTGNISRTAKQLYLSQSAVSQSLQQLESALGVRLFSRTARGVTLTAEGRRRRCPCSRRGRSASRSRVSF